MAILEKSRARKPLAENALSLSWSNYRANGEGERFNLHVSSEYDAHGKSNSYSLKLSPVEALRFVDEVARHMTFDDVIGTVDRRTRIERLEALVELLKTKEQG